MRLESILKKDAKRNIVLMNAAIKSVYAESFKSQCKEATRRWKMRTFEEATGEIYLDEDLWKLRKSILFSSRLTL